jgi:uncharacterized protein (DUF488 family)
MNTKPNIFIWSVGHSNVPINIFLNKLKENKIEVLVDVRTIPLSRFCPHFNEKPLRATLAKENINYLSRGTNLGGRAVNVRYEEAIDELVTLTKQGIRVCIMCSEKNFEKCHRYTVLTPSLEERGLLVIHILYDKTTNN